MSALPWRMNVRIDYESGGLSTSFSQPKSNFIFSALVAITGVSVPMGFSCVLMHLLSATPLQAFAAGAALCSTSIGTTFTNPLHDKAGQDTPGLHSGKCGHDGRCHGADDGSDYFESRWFIIIVIV